jgi:hypothetical protein
MEYSLRHWRIFNIQEDKTFFDCWYIKDDRGKGIQNINKYMYCITKGIFYDLVTSLEQYRK